MTAGTQVGSAGASASASARSASTATLRSALLSTAVALVVAAFVASCTSARGVLPSGPAPAPPPAAVEAFDDARRLVREQALAAGEERGATDARDAAVRAALEAAIEADPRWVAPRRLLDERDRARLDGARALSRRRAALTDGEVRADELYLAGRLEEAAGAVRFPQAIALDPTLAWPHHALSVDREIVGDLRGALTHEARAVARAYGGYELALFARRHANLLARTGQRDRALALLRGVLDDARPSRLDRHEVALDLVELEVAFESSAADRERGVRRALALCASPLTSRGEVATLLRTLSLTLVTRTELALRFDIEAALREHPDFADDDAFFDALRRRGTLAAARLVLPPVEGDDPWARLLASFEAGAFAAGVDTWVAALPAQARVDGAPADARLAALVVRARATDATDAGARLDLAEACLAAGWIEPALAIVRATDGAGASAAVAPTDADAGVDADAGTRARDLERRAMAARVVLDEIGAVLDASLGGEPVFEPVPPLAVPGDGDDPFGVDAPVAVVGRDLDLDALLEQVARIVERRGPELGWDAVPGPDAIRASPALRFGPFGVVLVPGPVFAARDEELGVGTAGEVVPGVAVLFDRLGRMALFGQPPFAPVDGTVLRRLAAYEASGEHLGVPWSGMVILCDGVEAISARSRSGLAISGAALHEGYWVDAAAERARLERWRAWQRELERRGADWARERIAATRLALDLGAGGDPRFERARLAPSLGAAQVLQLAVLLERSEDGSVRDGGDLVALGELVEVVATHEEGHLTDRTRFLPLGRNPLGIAALAASELFRPIEIERRLEYRAQLIALACVPDPRLALVDLLDAAAVDARVETVHAEAYRRILRDLLGEWNARLEADPEAWPEVDRGAYLLHQVHRLRPEEVRELAVALARREGLVRE